MNSITVATSDSLCPGCFAVKGGANPCPHCGYDEQAQRSDYLLPHRTLLHGQYLVGRVLGKPGGFGVTYLGWDLSLETRVAIKEYLPREWATRTTDRATVKSHAGEEGEWFRFGLDRFLGEARTLARIDHPNVVRVLSFFAANGTAYLVMDYYQGLSLAEYLERQGGRLPEAEALALIQPVLDGLRAIHAKGYLHRDVKPQNIYLAHMEKGRPRPILLDFGAARQVMAGRTRTMTVVYTASYAPIEQYHEKGKQGPWTDIYSAAAVLYSLVTGQHLPESIARLAGDKLKPAKDFGVSRPLSDALAAGLTIAPERRPQSVEAFEALLAPALPEERPARRRWGWLAVPASLLAGLLGLGGWYQYRGELQETGLHRDVDERAFAAAVTADTEAAYRVYLSACAPGGCGHQAEAERRLVAVAAREAKTESPVPPAAPPAPPSAPAPPALPMTGHLQVNVNAAAEVTLDERPVGRAAPDEPLHLEGIPVGEHRLRVTAAGYTERQESVQVAPGQWSQVPVVLAPQPAPPEAPAASAGPAPAADAGTEQALAISPSQYRDLQARLAALGYYPPGQVDGKFGAGTRKALQVWQRAAGLPDTGYLDRGQLERLRTAGDAQQVQRIHWESIQSSGSMPLLAEFLAMYPDGQYAGAARTAIAALSAPEKPAPRSARTTTPAEVTPPVSRPQPARQPTQRTEKTVRAPAPKPLVVPMPPIVPVTVDLFRPDGSPKGREELLVKQRAGQRTQRPAPTSAPKQQRAPAAPATPKYNEAELRAIDDFNSRR